MAFSPFSKITLVGTLFCLISAPQFVADAVRGKAIAAISPIWRWGDLVRDYLLDRPVGASLNNEPLCSCWEHQRLSAELESIYEWLLSEEHLQQEAELLSQLDTPHTSDFFRSRWLSLRSLLTQQLLSTPARVIYRDPASWSSSLWINVGDKEGITPNCPVLADGSLIGIVEHVEPSRSRVRLLTDSRLVPAVRTTRGNAQNRELSALLQAVSERVGARSELFQYVDEKNLLLQLIQNVVEYLGALPEEGYLARGELHGSSHALWHSKQPLLQGIGFHGDGEAAPPLKEGDLLVTSGLDGVFPPDLNVAIVTHVYPPKRNGYVYEVEARPTARSWHDLRTLLVLPALE